MKVSLTCTIKNEKDSIEQFLNSLLEQTRNPDEIIIVDGGSSDGTLEIIKNIIQKGKQINLIIEQGANISKGRNIAIENAKYEYIASADAGATYDKKWLENLCNVIEFDPDKTIDVVCGYFLSDAQNLYEECVGDLLYPKTDLIKWENYLPSNRSVLFKKKCWQEVNGYPEWLPRGIGEDSYFFINLKKSGYRFASAKNAICYWRPRKNLIKLFKQYYYYAYGSMIGGVSTTFLLKAYGNNVFLVLWNNLNKILKKKKFRKLLMSVVILITVGIAKLLGTFAGILGKRKN